MNSPLIYRPEIDGLRALAVLPVIFFHAGVKGFSGGFLGVDIFFVISGYLITSILMKDLRDGTFSFRTFYLRRARRILPALFFVILCTIPFALMWMLPLELEAFAKSIASILIFASNILFWRQSGYFDTASELKPMLHTWSLAVEEQFYILFPIILLLAWRYGRKFIPLLIGLLAAASLLLCEYYSRTDPSFNFYLAITRSWELLAGALCACVARTPHKQRDNVLSLLGLVGVLASIFLFDNSMRLPSVYALLPVGGAGLILTFATQGTLAARVLSWKPLVGIGLISYSAYLWHQPLFALARIRATGEVPTSILLTLTALVFPLAWLTWRYIETPFRTPGKSAWQLRKRLVLLSACAAVLLAAFGAAWHFTLGFTWRLKDRELVQATASSSPLREKCHFQRSKPVPVEQSCVYPGQNPSVAVYGNSHGVELAYGLSEALKARNTGLIHFTVSGCPASFGREAEKGCGEFYETRLKYILENRTIRSVVLAYRAEGADPAPARSIIDLANYLAAAGTKVILVLQAPTLPMNVSKYVRIALAHDADKIPARLRSEWTKLNQNLYGELGRLNAGVTVYDLANLLCTETACFAVLDGAAMYFDDNHISVPAARKAAAEIVKLID